MNKFISYGFVSSIALLPGLLLGSQSAQALTFAQGSLQLSGGLVLVEGTGVNAIDPLLGVEVPVPTTTFDFSRLDGTQNPDDTGEFLISGATGDLSALAPLPFEFGLIKDLTTFDTTNLANPFGLPVDNFLDFSTTTVPVPGGNLGNYFDLEAISIPLYTQTGTGITVSVGVRGTFQIQGFLDTPGQGTFGAEITFGQLQQAGLNINSLQQFLDFLEVPGNTLPRLSWSGTASLETVRPVPEPSSLVGLLALTGSGLLMSRKREQKQK